MTDETWEDLADAVGAFRRDRGRWPSADGRGAEERRLGRWLADRRITAKAGTAWLDQRRYEYLDRVAPGWAGARSEQEWIAFADALGVFYAERGRWPSQTAQDPQERRLGRWLGMQRRRATRGAVRFPPDRRTYLDAAAPGWSARSPGSSPYR